MAPSDDQPPDDQPPADQRSGERGLDVGAFIRQQRLLGRVSLRGLAEAAGVSNPYLSQIERGLRKPSAEILQQLARALEISSETLYVLAGILDPRDSEADLIADIRNDPHINEDQKKTLIRIYESFRRENGDDGAEGGDDIEMVLTEGETELTR